MPKVQLLQEGIVHPLPKEKMQSILLFIMRVSVCVSLFFVMCLNLFATTHAAGQSIRETMVSFEVHDASLKATLEKLQEQSGFSIFYSSNLLNKDKRVTISSGTRSVAQVLDMILTGTNLVYIDKGAKVILQEKKAVQATRDTSAPSNGILVHGIVKDETGEPIPGATVHVKNGKKYVASDQNGHFSIEVEDPNSVLTFSIVGYTTQDVALKGQTSFPVTMVRSFSSLNEVQVLGYSSTTKRNNTGAVSSIKASEIAVQTVSNPLTALQGHIAGMEITQDNGLPGGGVRVRIRGNASIMSGYLPLYVVDGVPFTLFNGGTPATDALNSYGISGASGNLSPFSMIAPEDIERIDVLKDADATAIYGSKGANGVVLITTKKGSHGNTKVSANVSHGFGEVSRYIPMLNTPEYLAMRKEAFTNAGTTPGATDFDLTKWDQTAYTDWQKWAIGGKAKTTTAMASVSGGNAQNTFLYSTSYRKEGTVFPGENNTITFSNRINASHSSKDNRFNISLSANYSYMKSDMPKTDLSAVYNLAPNFNPYNADGTFNWDLGVGKNPAALLLQKYTGQTYNLITDLNLRYNIIKELAIKANLGFTQNNLEQQGTQPNRSVNSTAIADNQLLDSKGKNDNWIVEPFLEFNKTFGDAHLQVIGGTTFQQTKATSTTLRGSGYTSEALLNAISAAGTVIVYGSNYSLYKYAAGFGRFNFNYKEKYYLDGTFRRDGSSRFGINNQFGSFGALGAAWIFSQEDFMADLKPVSFGKLRASYGVTGNDQIANYMYTPIYNTLGSTYSYMGTPGLVANGLSNPNLKWETTKKLDIALELGFLKDRIMLKTDYYQNRTSNMLAYITTPTQIGVNSYAGNLPATIQNKGWEFELNTTNIATKKFSWNTTLNLTINQNKLLAFDNIKNSSYANTYTVGKSVDAPNLFHFQGIDPTTGAPILADLNKSGAVDFNDRSAGKVGVPFYGGLTNSITYNGFTLDFTFQFNHRYGYLNSTLNNYFYPFGYDMTNQSTAVLNRWHGAGDGSNIPGASKTYSNNYYYYAYSDANWGDASFIKFKTLSLTYNLPRTLLNKVKIANASIYARGQNLYTWAKQKYTLDPETTQPGTGAGLGTGQYIAVPQLRTLTVGLNLSL
ncbi:SusC/RagA family TonB-linked outer membrane protein [Chitinophaga silvisoli]|uniref:SusC/RagA family TonB-linked outer membrane protein n=2 Tax=Chitinophaga silvisoli TaxID=2291814 RepID=A0A3E1NTU9_9BACT|nr:SusC/RagA family TonB-linked outer membrane protein [Chitinophaga silvisoli]